MNIVDLPWGVSGAIVLTALIVLLAIGVPIGFSLGLVAVTGLIMVNGLDSTLSDIAVKSYSEVTNYVFIAFPLFVLMAEFMSQGGVGKRMIDMTQKTLGRLPGSLALVSIGASTIFAAVCGSAAVGAVAISDLLLPECMQRKYDKTLIAGTIAAGGTLSILIPPSFMLILWGIIAEVSIGELFVAGIIPGIIVAVVFSGYIIFRSVRNPSLCPMAPETTWKEKGKALVGGWEIAVIIIVVLGGIYSGIATVTEVASLGALSALILALAHRSLSLPNMIEAFKRSGELIGFFVIIFIGAELFKHLLTYLEVPQGIATTVVDLDLSPIVLVIVIQLIFFILGCFMDAPSVTLITLPLFLSSLQVMDIDLIWLGIVVTISAMMANITPPVGFSLFILKGVGEQYGITFGQIVRGSAPFIALLTFIIALLLAFPPLTTWLPNTM